MIRQLQRSRLPILERAIRCVILWRIHRRWGFRAWGDAPDGALAEWTAFLRWRAGRRRP
jgi:hypothetical protein